MSALHEVAHRAARAISRTAARVHLRGVTRLGARAQTIGSPFVDNGGRIDIGDDFHFSSKPLTSHLVVARGGCVTIGNAVTIECGAAIACHVALTIGDRVRIGRGVMILDTDFHAARSMHSRGEPAPIVIEDDAEIGDGAVVLKGARIGKAARVAAKSVVSGVVAPNVFVSGVPAREKKGRTDGDVSARVEAIVASTLGVLDARDAEWDSLGALRLLLALEEDLGVKLADDALHDVASTAEIIALIERSV